jgi:hypothetical protein
MVISYEIRGAIEGFDGDSAMVVCGDMPGLGFGSESMSMR